MRISTIPLIVAVLAASLYAADKTVTLSAGKSDRTNAVVTFPMPAGLGNGPFQLAGESGRLEIQVTPDGRAILILPSLKAGQSATFKLEQAPMVKRSPRPTDMMAARQGTNVTFTIGDSTVMRYNGDKTPLPEGYEPAFQRGGYIHPVLTPSGKALTDDYPPKHKHHHGIWSPWTKTIFEDRKPDFWNMGQKSGSVEFAELGQDYFGPIASGFSAKHRMMDLLAKPAPKAAINEQWDVTIYSVPFGAKPYYVFDVLDTQNCAGESPLILPKYHYGGMGIRGHRDWEGKGDKCLFITSEGKDRANGNESRGRWCWMGGKIGDAMAGITIFDHPTNFRHPQPMRLNPDEPFFCYSPSQLGEWKIEPGKPYVARYRFIVMDGALDKELIERLYADFATPVEVTIQ